MMTEYVTAEELRRVRATQRATILLLETMLGAMEDANILPSGRRAAFVMSEPKFQVIDPELRALWEIVWKRLAARKETAPETYPED